MSTHPGISGKFLQIARKITRIARQLRGIREELRGLRGKFRENSPKYCVFLKKFITNFRAIAKFQDE